MKISLPLVNATHIHFDKFRAQPCCMLIIKIRNSNTFINIILQKKRSLKSFLYIINFFKKDKIFQGELLLFATLVQVL